MKDPCESCPPKKKIPCTKAETFCQKWANYIISPLIEGYEDVQTTLMKYTETEE